MRNARAHKLQWSGPTVHSSTVATMLVTAFVSNIIIHQGKISFYCFLEMPVLLVKRLLYEASHRGIKNVVSSNPA